MNKKKQMKNKLFVLLFLLFFILPSLSPSSILFWNNFQNPSHYSFLSSRIILNDNREVIFQEVIAKSSPSSSFLMSASNFNAEYFSIIANNICVVNGQNNQCPEYFHWDYKYIRVKGSAECPLQSWGSCAIGYTRAFQCSCGGKGGCSMCYEQAWQPCECMLLYGYVQDLLFINKEFKTSSTSGQFEISFLVKGTGILRVVTLYKVRSCPIGTVLRSINGEVYAQSPFPAVEITLDSNAFVLSSTSFFHNVNSCDAYDEKSIMLGFNGYFEMKDLIVFNPEESRSEDYFNSEKDGILYTGMTLEINRFVDSVSYKDVNNLTLMKSKKPRGDSYERSITKIYGSSSGNSYLETFDNIISVVGLGQNNVLVFGIEKSYLRGGEKNTTFVVKQLKGTFYIENFSIEKEDNLDLVDFYSHHNLTQIKSFFSSCGEGCLSLKINLTEVILQSIDIIDLEKIKIIFKEYPCHQVCPECRVPDDCIICKNCADALCDLKGCHECNNPYYVSLFACVDECPLGDFIDEKRRKCINCNIDYCERCDESFECFRCQSDKFLFLDKCFVSCPARSCPDKDEKPQLICVNCTENCNKCTAAIGCLECDPEYSLYQTKNMAKRVCIKSGCEEYEYYNEKGVCQKYTETDYKLLKNSDDPWLTLEKKNWAKKALDPTFKYLNMTMPFYYSKLFDTSIHYTCQKDTTFLPNPKDCRCGNQGQVYPKNGVDYSLLACLSTIIKMTGLNETRLCNDTFSIFDEECNIDLKRLEIAYGQNLKYENYYTVIKDFKKKEYDKEKFKFVFDKIRGRSDVFVLLKLLDQSVHYLPYHTLLINWELNIESETTVNSFEKFENFTISDPFQGCEKPEKRLGNLNFTYGSEDLFTILNFVIIYKKQNSSQPILNHVNCKRYLSSTENCKVDVGIFQYRLEKKAENIAYWIKGWENLSFPSQCALLDIAFEIPDYKLMKMKKFKSLIESLQFSLTIENYMDENPEYITNERIKEALSTLKNQIIPSRATLKCNSSVFDLERDRLCSLSKIIKLSENITQNLINNTNDVKELKSADFPNLILGSKNLFLQTAASEALKEILRKNPKQKIFVNSGLITLPEFYLLKKWKKLCPNINSADESFLNGLTIDVENYFDVVGLMEERNFQWNGKNKKNTFTFVGEGKNDLRIENVKAFQILWNCNFGEELIQVDGLYGVEVEEKIKKMNINGFEKLC